MATLVRLRIRLSLDHGAMIEAMSADNNAPRCAWTNSKDVRCKLLANHEGDCDYSPGDGLSLNTLMGNFERAHSGPGHTFGHVPGTFDPIQYRCSCGRGMLTW